MQSLNLEASNLFVFYFDDDGGDGGEDGVDQWVSGKFELGASVVI